VNVGRVLDRSFKLIRDNFVLLTAIILIVYFPLFFFQFFMRTLEMSAQQMTAGPFVQTDTLLVGFAAVAVAAFAWVFIVPLGQMAVTSAIQSIYLGRRVSAVQAYLDVLRLFLRALGLVFIVGFLLVLGWLFCVVPGILVTIVFFVVFPVCVVEKRGIFETLERSYRLTKKNWMSIFVIIFLVGLIKYAVSGALSLAGEALFTSPSTLSVLGNALINFTGTVLVAPLDLVVSSVVYFELREAREGFDLELMARSVVADLRLQDGP
jgi:hypothetical protein